MLESTQAIQESRAIDTRFVCICESSLQWSRKLRFLFTILSTISECQWKFLKCEPKRDFVKKCWYYAKTNVISLCILTLLS